MEIIHLILGKANPDRLNGVNKVVYQMAEHQAMAGKNIKLWGITDNCVHDYPKRSFITELFQAHKNPFKIDEALKKSILAHRQSVFHLHGGWVPIYSSLAAFFAKHKIKYVLTAHGAYNTVAMKRSRWTKLFYYHFFEKKVLQYAYKIHAIGASEVLGLNSFFKNNKSFLMPYGFKFDLSSQSPIKEKDRFVIGFMGRFDAHTKGLDLLLDAFERLEKKYPTVCLWFLGDGADKPLLEKTVKDKALKNVIFWGSVFGAEKQQLLSQMNVFAHPSRNEGLPSGVLEAIAAGTPVVVSKATNVGSYVVDYNTGLEVENESSDALFEAFENLYLGKISLSENFAEKSKAMLLECFDWKNLIEKYDRLYC